MGGCCSIQISCDKVLDRVGSCFCGEDNYICYLEKNLESLERAMEDLTATRDDVMRRVQEAEGRGQQRLRRVQLWLTRVESIENRFNGLNSTRTVELQRLCCCGVCSKRLRLSYSYGRRIFEMLQDVETRKSDGDFQEVAQATFVVRPQPPTIIGGMLGRAWNHLMDIGTGIMGLYGMGGVGTTTLLTQINNRFNDTNYGVDIVIWVGVSWNLEVEKIQNEIAEELGLSGGEWNQKSRSQKAINIHTLMSDKKFVLLLDDIWSKVDLVEIGVPFPTRKNGSKVVFTTRSRDVCGRMGVNDPMEVSCLEPDEAWDLFKMKVGENTLKGDPEILKLARKVAEKCHGLPLALTVIGEIMACKTTVQEWHYAVDTLNSNAAKFSGMEDQILPILKSSYDHLNMEQVQSCFLYCSLFPENYRMEKERLIDYWKCEGFIDENESRERELSHGYEIIGILVRACLLLEEGINKEQVKMHGLVRDMALWIASDLGRHKEQCIVQAGVELREVPKVKNWNSVRRMSLMENEIEIISGSPECPELTTLFLQRNSQLVNISGEFFSYMPKLVVLDLSWNQILDRLPEEILRLYSLRFLDLSRTKIKQLPVGFQGLTKLIHLNLEWTLELESISGISKLWNLRTLRLQRSKLSPDVNLVKELELLEHLEVLTIEISSSFAARQLLSSRRLVECTKEVNFKNYQELLTLPTMGSLSGIRILSCGMKEIEIERATSSLNKSPASPCFFSLFTVLISNCNGLKDLTWLLLAPNLTNLEVSFSDQLEDIISEEKALSSVTDDEASSIIPFGKLEKLQLWNLPNLKSIYWNTLPFPCLREIDINKCPNLTKLALDSQSVDRFEELVINYREEEWIENVEWEDEATRLRFLPSFKLVK
ncbi:PREDICTED: probable disease resistance protein At1g12280 isoform X2 [Camelina sativa]|nr:PREDICTED: probable disease resistance protein At1g12280 isoform X2 [Camelina sativa]